MDTSNDSEPIRIVLALRLSERDRALAVRYLLTPRSLSPKERISALDVFDELGASHIIIGKNTETFAAFYRTQVEKKYADIFLEQLLGTDNPEKTGTQLARETWQQILRDLQTWGLDLAGGIEQQCFIVFCGYWWQSFSKGYIREVAVFQELERSGIQFTAHNLRQRQERFSSHDLIVHGFRGDVKTSAYFLHVARSFPLTNDFYLVRLYDPARRSWLDVVMMKPAMWQALDGDTTPCELDEVAQLLPMPLLLMARDEALTVITYEEWKQRIMRLQVQKQEE